MLEVGLLSLKPTTGQPILRARSDFDETRIPARPAGRATSGPLRRREPDHQGPSQEARAATSPELKAAFEKHLKETEGQVGRLEQAFEHLGEKARKKTHQAIKGLIEEGAETIKEDAEPEVKDAALIAAAQRVEHYEMAGYGSVSAYAKLLGEKAVLKLLQETLAEEKATDEALNELAESMFNLEAV